LNWSPVFIPLAWFFVLAVALYVAGHTLDLSETRQALVLLAEDLVFYFLAVQLFPGGGSESLHSFGLAVLVFGGCLGLFTILQFASGTHRIYGLVDTPTGALFGPYVNRDHFSGLMEMLIPVAILYIAGRRSARAVGASALLIFAATLAVASLMLSGSRGGLMALSAEIVIAALALRRTIARTLEGRRLAIAAVMALLMGVVLFIYVDEGGSAKRLSSVANVDRTWADWAGERKSMALDTFRMWRDHPILGVGLGDFEIAYPRYQSFPSDDYIDHAHNDYIEAAAETGLVGTLLILWALALFTHLAFRGWRQPVQSPVAWVRLGAAIGCFGLLVHSFWDFNLHIPANAAWFAVLAGIATAARRPQ
jgi:O-antigen ligase